MSCFASLASMCPQSSFLPSIFYTSISNLAITTLLIVYLYQQARQFMTKHKVLVGYINNGSLSLIVWETVSAESDSILETK
jgi:hypothetical protein